MPITSPEYSFNSQLMNNYAAELPIDASHQPESMRAGGVPWVFSIGTDKQLYAITPQASSPSGWIQSSMTKGMGDVTALGAVTLSDGQFRLAIGVTVNGSASVYVCAATDFTTFDVANINSSTFWEQRSLGDASLQVDQLRVDANGVLVGVSKSGASATYITVSDAGVATTFPLPEDGSTVIALELGQVFGDRGVFLLYKIGNTTTMAFRSFPDPVWGKSSTYRFDAGTTINDFALLPSSTGDNQLVTVGDGAALFSNPDTPFTPIVPSGSGLNLLKVRAATDDTAYTLWLLGAKNADSGLYYVTNHFYEGSSGTYIDKWTSPLMLHASVSLIAPLRGAGVANEVYMIDRKNVLVRLWQDGTSTLWQVMAVPVADVGSAREFHSYTVHVQFTSDSPSDTVGGKQVTVTSPSTCTLAMNGANFQLAPAVGVLVTLDATGALDIVCPTASLAAPTLQVTADFLTAPQSLDLMHEIRASLAAIQTGTDLSNATKYDPATNKQVPLLDAGQSAATLDAVAASVKNFLAAAAAMPAPLSIERRDHVLAVAAGARPTSGEKMWALCFTDDGEIRLLEGDEAFAHICAKRESTSSDDLGHTFGDVIRWIEDTAQTVVSLVVSTVGQVIHFTLTFASNIYDFVVTTAHEVFAAVEWVFRQIKVGLKEVVAWLGFLFSWQDILATKNALSQMLNDTLAGIASSSANVRTNFDVWIASTKSDIGSAAFQARLQASANTTLDGWAAQNPGQPAKDTDPRLRWAGTRFHHFADSDVTATGSTLAPPGAIGTLFSSLETLVGELVTAYQGVSADASSWLENGMSTADFAAALANAIGILAIDVLQLLVDGILALIQALVASVTAQLNAEITVPFFSALYRNYISDQPLTLLDALSLILAIPMTVASKLACNAAPFSTPSGTVLAGVPKTFFASFGTLHDDHGSESPTLNAAPPGGAVPYALMGSSRLLRTITVPLVTTLAMTPQLKMGTGGILLADRTFRLLSALAALGAGQITPLKRWATASFSMTWIVTAAMYVTQTISKKPCAWAAATPEILAGKLGKEFNALNLIDSICVSSVGIWGMVVTKETWDTKDDALRAAEVMIEIFQSPALLAFFANAIAKTTPNPINEGIAVGLATVRVAGMFGSGISELVAAKEAS